jgi:hypothetical protein
MLLLLSGDGEILYSIRIYTKYFSKVKNKYIFGLTLNLNSTFAYKGVNYDSSNLNFPVKSFHSLVLLILKDITLTGIRHQPKKRCENLFFPP